jgi:hypothetical protein
MFALYQPVMKIYRGGLLHEKVLCEIIEFFHENTRLMKSYSPLALIDFYTKCE